MQSVLFVDSRLSKKTSRSLTTMSDVSHRRSPPQRTTSGPFVRKPIPHHHDDNDLPTTTIAASHPPSYSSIQDEGELSDAPVGGTTTGNANSLERHLTLLDLIAVGIGGTIGSGLFVLVGLVSHEYAGPSAVLSWAVSGLAALLSGCCYAELSARIPLPGSAYAYCFVALGEWPAFLAATCLSLEYIVACGAVARSWGDKCALWLLEELGMVENPPTSRWVQILLNTHDSTFNPLACFIAALCTCLLLCGVRESKLVTNFFTSLKVSLVVFMIVVGSFYVQPQNYRPFLPFGIGGTFRGATATFFGYVLESCCVLTFRSSPSSHDSAIGETVIWDTTRCQEWQEKPSIQNATFPSLLFLLWCQ